MNTVEKLLSTFSLFSSERVEWSVEDAAVKLNLPRSTTYRYFKALAEAGLIMDFIAGRYVLGPAIIQFDTNTRVHDPLMRVGVSVMRRLAGELSAPAVFLMCRLYKRQVICIHQEPANFAHAPNYERGRLMPLHRGAASKIILAHLPASLVRAYFTENKSDIRAVNLGSDWILLKRNLRIMRNANFSVTHAELDTDETCIAVPLFAPDGAVLGSLGLIVEHSEHRAMLHSSIVDEVRVAGKQISSGIKQITSSWKSFDEPT